MGKKPLTPAQRKRCRASKKRWEEKTEKSVAPGGTITANNALPISNGGVRTILTTTNSDYSPARRRRNRNRMRPNERGKRPLFSGALPGGHATGRSIPAALVAGCHANTPSMSRKHLPAMLMSNRHVCAPWARLEGVLRCRHGSPIRPARRATDARRLAGRLHRFHSAGARLRNWNGSRFGKTAASRPRSGGPCARSGG